jgi:hypothetical protein
MCGRVDADQAASRDVVMALAMAAAVMVGQDVGRAVAGEVAAAAGTNLPHADDGVCADCDA